jgi:hypothetical protein
MVKWYSCLCLTDLRLRNDIPARILGTSWWRNTCTWVAKWFSWLYQRHLRWRNGIPARIWETCGGEMAFLLVSGGPSLYRGHLRRRDGTPRIWDTGGGEIVSLLESGGPVVAEWFSCLYLGHLRWYQEGFGQRSAKSVMVLPGRRQPKIDQLRLYGAKTEWSNISQIRLGVTTIDSIKMWPNPSCFYQDGFVQIKAKSILVLPGQIRSQINQIRLDSIKTASAKKLPNPS